MASQEETQAELIASVLRELLHALAVPDTAPVRAVVRELLTQAGSGTVSGVSPALAEPAREEVRRSLLADGGNA